jgi:hypothetical protein
MAAHGAPTLTLCALAGDYPELFAEQVASQLTPEELLHKVCPSILNPTPYFLKLEEQEH